MTVTRDQAVLLALGGLSLVCVVLIVAVVRLRATASRSAADLAFLHARLGELEAQAAAMARPGPTTVPAAAPVDFVITDLGREPLPEPVHLDGPAFADIVLKETVVKAASFAHGVRRGLAPATRNRIRFEMKQEVRRARKQRRADLKAARRDLHAQQRVALDVDTEKAS
jgi:hypothetical protein